MTDTEKWKARATAEAAVAAAKAALEAGCIEESVVQNLTRDFAAVLSAAYAAGREDERDSHDRPGGEE